MTENIYEHIDLCEIYEPIFEPPESFLKECTQYWLSEWRKRCKPFVFPDGSYVLNSEGEIHYYRNGIMVRACHRYGYIDILGLNNDEIDFLGLEDGAEISLLIM